MSNNLHVGVAGLGAVGAATVKLLTSRTQNIESLIQKKIIVTAVSARDRTKDRGFSLEGVNWHSDPIEMLDDEIDVLVEAIGGADGIAKDLIEGAIAKKKHVVTANKALIAHHGMELAKSSEKAQVALLFEAAVAGGIPIIKALREGLSANTIDGVYGILNGTCNYILSNMRETGKSFEEVLQDAQNLGYAESDPTFDIKGIDAAHKLSILSAIAFGKRPSFSEVYTEGIELISPFDFAFADELGFRIKLLSIANSTKEGIEQRVHPCLVPLETPIAHVEGVFNAVVVLGDNVGGTMYEGRGAGSNPTASAVVADLIDLGLGHSLPAFGMQSGLLEKPVHLNLKNRKGTFYIRFTVIDRPGVFAELATVFRDNGVSMERIIQRGHHPDTPAQVVLTTHEATENAISETISTIDGSGITIEPTLMIRIETNLLLT